MKIITRMLAVIRNLDCHRSRYCLPHWQAGETLTVIKRYFEMKSPIANGCIRFVTVQNNVYRSITTLPDWQAKKCVTDSKR